MDGVKYRAIKGKDNRTWLVPLCVDAADHIHCTEPGNPPVSGNRDFAGYAGRTLMFELEDGTNFFAHGPWHSNSDALKEATGLDINNLHMTMVVISSKRTHYNEPPLGDLYKEKSAHLGSFDRGRTIGQAIADVMQKPVVVTVKSGGGGSDGWTFPTGTTLKDWEPYIKEAWV